METWCDQGSSFSSNHWQLAATEDEKLKYFIETYFSIINNNCIVSACNPICKQKEGHSITMRKKMIIWIAAVPLLFLQLPHKNDAFLLEQRKPNHRQRPSLFPVSKKSISDNDEIMEITSTKKSVPFDNRRQNLIKMAAIWASFVASAPSAQAGLLPLPEKPKRQLELCIVSLIRVLYWAEKAVTDLKSDDTNVRKQRYLEARLASKAMVTGKVGGGASYNVFTLNSLQVKDCLSDLVSYKTDKKERRQAEDLQTDLIEALASIVEFDGLETTLDTSPRSSLTLTMYTEDKATFVRQTLSERVIPTATQLIRLYGSSLEAQCVDYVHNTYPNEVPPSKQPPKQATAEAAD